MNTKSFKYDVFVLLRFLYKNCDLWILILLGFFGLFSLLLCICLQRFSKKFWRLYHIWHFSHHQYLWICGVFGQWWWKHWRIGQSIFFQVWFLTTYRLIFFIALFMMKGLVKMIYGDLLIYWYWIEVETSWCHTLEDESSFKKFRNNFK